MNYESVEKSIPLACMCVCTHSLSQSEKCEFASYNAIHLFYNRTVGNTYVRTCIYLRAYIEAEKYAQSPSLLRVGWVQLVKEASLMVVRRMLGVAVCPYLRGLSDCALVGESAVVGYGRIT